MSRQVTLVTPTYRGDFERFCLQRESIEQCGIDIPHIAIVHHEDVALFQSTPFKSNLQIVSTKDVLPPKIEARRANKSYPRRNPLHWITPKPLHGWMSQQLVKLAAVSVVSTDGYVCLDSDIFFVNKVTHEDFFSADGRLHLYETENDIDAEMVEWYVCSLRFLGVPLRKQPILRYIHAMAPLHCRVVKQMQAFIEDRYSQDWINAILNHPMIFEYMTYGVYARYINELEGLYPVQPSLCVNYWWPDQMETIEEDLYKRIGSSNGKAVLVQSNFGRPVSEYHRLAQRAWEVTMPGQPV